jgi:uncharacterized membrane protein
MNSKSLNEIQIRVSTIYFYIREGLWHTLNSFSENVKKKEKIKDLLKIFYFFLYN